MPKPFANTVLLGAGGMLGRCWTSRGENSPLLGSIVGLSRKQCDLTRPDELRSAIPPETRLVINAAAYTNVDAAEENEDVATQINGYAVGRLADHCRSIGATLVHYSTDYVFNGRASIPYLTDQPRDPINAYGRSKAVGEELLEQSGCDSLLIRSSWLYAPHSKNFVRTIARACQNNPTLRVVNDQVGRPTSAQNLVVNTLRLLDVGARGVHHLCDDGQCTWFDFARAIVKRVNPDCQVQPCPTSAYPRAAKRPAYSVLDLSRSIDAIGEIQPWNTALSDVLDHLTKQSTQTKTDQLDIP